MAGKKQKRNKSNAGTILLLVLAFSLILGGVAVLIYPHVTGWLYQTKVTDEREQFVERIQQPAAIKNESDDAEVEKTDVDFAAESPYEELYQELVLRNETLFEEKQSKLTDPFVYETPDIDLTEYGLTDNIIGYLSIPAMDVEVPILLGANTENLMLGAVHMTETSYPVGGINSNCVLAAHRGYSKAPMFRNIDRLQIGDWIYIQNFREQLIYEVVETKVIEPTEVEQCLIQEGRDLVTLLTCHPYRKTTQRYIVYCERIENE